MGRSAPGKHVTSVLSLGSYPSPHWPSDNASYFGHVCQNFRSGAVRSRAGAHSPPAPSTTQTTPSSTVQYKIRKAWMHKPVTFVSPSFCWPVHVDGRCSTDIVMSVLTLEAAVASANGSCRIDHCAVCDFLPFLSTTWLSVATAYVRHRSLFVQKYMVIQPSSACWWQIFWIAHVLRTRRNVSHMGFDPN